MRDAEKPGRLASLASMLFAFSHRARPQASPFMGISFVGFAVEWLGVGGNLRIRVGLGFLSHVVRLLPVDCSGF